MTVWIVAGITVILTSVALVRGSGRRVVPPPASDEVPILAAQPLAPARSSVS